MYQDPASFLDILNEGVAMLVYHGHANAYTLSAARYFTTWSVDALRNGDRLPICVLGGCGLSFDPRDTISIPVHLLEQSGGGAIACVASSGLTFESAVHEIFKKLFDLLEVNTEYTAGQAFRAAKNARSDAILRRLAFLGDPAIHIKRPAGTAPVIAGEGLPRSISLEQNYPNPFNPATTITFRIPKACPVELKIFDLLGKEVITLVNEERPPGDYTVQWDGKDYRRQRVASGIYFGQLRAGGFAQTRKLVFMQ